MLERNETIMLRVAPHAKVLLRDFAETQHMTLNEFIISSLSKAIDAQFKIPISPVPLVEIVAEYIKSTYVEGHPNGELLPEADALAHSIDASKRVIHKALRVLESAGHIHISWRYVCHIGKPMQLMLTETVE